MIEIKDQNLLIEAEIMRLRKSFITCFVLIFTLGIGSLCVPASVDKPAGNLRIKQLRIKLKKNVPLANPVILETIQTGERWLAALNLVSQRIAGGKTTGLAKFITDWNKLTRETSPSTILTGSAISLRSDLAANADNSRALIPILKRTQRLAEELVLELEALDRIERYRRRDVTILVKGQNGEPLRGARVDLRQTRHAFLFGCNIFAWNENETERQLLYRQRFADLFNFATLGFYWGNYERRQGVTQEDHWRRVAEWCKAHGIECKGHPLVWNYADPRWLPKDSDKVYEYQMERVRREVKNFAGSIDMWDVVNEATSFDRKSFWERAPIMTAMWDKIGQMKLTIQSFQTARQSNPQATLLINDYYFKNREEAEKDDSITGKEREIYEDVIETLADKNGKPLYDVIGIQSHMHGGAWDTTRILEVVKRFAKYDVPLHFTETTIVSGPRGRSGERQWGETTPEGEKEQADEVERFYRTLYSCPEVEALTWWDFSDYRAWQGAPAGFLRRDMSPKPAYERLLSLIKDQWWTDVSARTDGKGRVRMRAFTGDYELSVTTEDGGKIRRNVTLLRDESPHEIVVDL